MKHNLVLSRRLMRAALVALSLMIAGVTESLAQSFTVGNLNYSINDDGVSVTVIGYVESNLNVDIPESVLYDGTSYTVTRIGEGAFYYYNSSGLNLSVTIPSTISSTGYLPFEGASFTTVNYNAINCVVDNTNSLFYNCSGLTNLNIGEGVEVIPHYMFSSASFSGALVIPESVTSIGMRAFANNGFTTLNFNAVNCTMGYHGYWGWEVAVFENCPLTTLNIGNNVQTIPYGAFDGLSSLSGTLVIPNSVTTIGGNAFNNCSGLTGSLTLPESLITIGASAFGGCTGFTGNIVIPNSVTSIGDYAFADCTGLTGDLVIPNLVTSIGLGTFANCVGFTSLTIGTGVENIGAYNYWTLEQDQNPFYNCSGITTLNYNAVDCYYIPIEWYGDAHSPFAYLSSLTTLNIGTSVQKIPPFAFDGCTGLAGTLSIPSSVTEIGPEAFRNCSGLTGAISIPESVTSIGGGAFDGCSGLGGSLTIGPNVTSIGPRAFAYTGIEAVNFNPTNCEDIGSSYYIYAKPGYYEYDFRYGYAFEGCENLTTLNIGNGVERIPECAFSSCTSLTGELSIPNSVTYIGGSAFEQCTGFAGSLQIPDAVTYIGWNAFEGCSGFDGTVTLGENLQCVASNAFANTSFTTMNYNATNCFVGYIDEYENLPYYETFCLPSSLTTLNFGDNVQSISHNAFKGCSFLDGALTLPNSLTTIGDQAFYNCYGFESIVMGNSVETIGSEAFRNCGGIKGELTLPETLLSVGNHAFASCDEISTINYNAVNCSVMGNAQSPVFYDCASVAHINIGENVENIPNYAFKRCSTVVDMNVAAEVPPTIGSSTFGTVSRSIPVSVPYGSGNAYRTAQYWEEFFNITEDYSPSQYTHHWSVNFHQFENSMTVIGLIQIDGVEQATDALEIGAFVGEECRGRQLLAYYSGLDHYLVFLTLYGEDGEEFGFRLYDHEAKEELPMGCTTHITFETDATIGTLAEPYPFNFTNMHVAQLAQGWNWWSTYVEQEGIDGLSMLEESLGENGITIKSQNGYVQYMPDYNIWYGSTGFAVNNESFYMVQTNAACEVEMSGSQANPANHPIPLATGWNWIGYPCTSHMSFATAFAGITPTDNDQVKSQGHGFASYMEAYGIWYGTLADYGIDPGMGLMYKSNNGETFSFTYPQGRGEEPVGNDFVENNYWNANYNTYANNMTVTAVVELDDVELGSENYELAAFANGECRGSVKLMHVAPLNRYMAFLTVAGDEASKLRFSLYDAETGTVETECLATLQYESDATIGSFESPYVVRFRSTTSVDELGSRISVFPNPVARGEKVNIDLKADNIGKMRVEIVNALGEVVETQGLASPQTIHAPNTAGVYMLRITVDGEGTCCRKLVVR